jgi:hypothetical protein
VIDPDHVGLDRLFVGAGNLKCELVLACVQIDRAQRYGAKGNDLFSAKPVMEGAGAAAGEAYAWAIANPDGVSCIYGENPVLRSRLSQTPLDNLASMAKAGVPLLHVCGSLDPWLNDQTRVAEKRYKELGGQIRIIIKEGERHFPTAPRDPKSIVDFITKQAN